MQGLYRDCLISSNESVRRSLQPQARHMIKYHSQQCSVARAASEILCCLIPTMEYLISGIPCLLRRPGRGLLDVCVSFFLFLFCPYQSTSALYLLPFRLNINILQLSCCLASFLLSLCSRVTSSTLPHIVMFASFSFLTYKHLLEFQRGLKYHYNITVQCPLGLESSESCG